jgi:hypothetical protein
MESCFRDGTRDSECRFRFPFSVLSLCFQDDNHLVSVIFSNVMIDCALVLVYTLVLCVSFFLCLEHFFLVEQPASDLFGKVENKKKWNRLHQFVNKYYLDTRLNLVMISYVGANFLRYRCVLCL